MDSDNIFWLGRVIFDFLAEFHDMLIKGTRGSFIIQAPDFIQKSKAVDDLSLVA
jgi:hypothetical protein